MTIQLTFAQGDQVHVHSTDCQDLHKAEVKRAAYEGIYTYTYPEDWDERDIWLEYNQEFLDEGGMDCAQPLIFHPCTAKTGLKPNKDRSWD